MHMSLPQKFPPPVTARRPSISRLRNIITIAAATFFVLVFFLAIKFYLPGEPDFVATENSSTPTTAAVVPKPPQKNLEPTNEEKTIDSSIPNAFNPPTPATERFSINDGDSLILTGVKNITEWHSVGRPPARKDCWSYAARFKPYASPSQEVLDLISNNNKPTNSRAFIVRLSTGHPWKKEFNLHARAVVLEAGLVNYDVFFLVHTDLSSSERKKWIKDHVPAEFRNLTQTFSTKDVKNWLNGTAPFKNIMENNHLALQMFVTNNKQYDFIYSIESDVRLIGRWDQFLTDIDEEYKSHRERQGSDQDMPETPDLVTFEALKRPSDKWLWLDDKCLKDFGGHEDLRRHSLKLEELGKNDPRTVQYEKAATGCTYFFVNPHSQPFWDEWYKARKNPDSCWPTALVHPIKGEFFN
ncbi:hypothetical protein TWF679_000613 [Orbilia oligospora]|uniref:Uncharacterized protein n=1 Tax=Orbilia oligospora TaxID=2813651 RepID=A0A8H8UXE2_ORBOL|nr:hypothetical protein TWF679_000613 [Orbilia oligospora]